MISIVRNLMIGVTLVCWLMSLYKLRDLARAPHYRPLRALCLALVGVTVSLTIQPFMPALDRAIGVLDLGRALANCLTLVSATAAQAFLLHMTGNDERVRRQMRRRTVALTVCVAAIAVLFALTPAGADLDDPRVVSGRYYGEPFDAPFLFVYLGHLGWSVTQVAVLAGRYAREAGRPLLRAGLRMIMAGAAWGLLYVVAKLAAIAAGALWPDSGLISDAVVVFTFTVSILLILIGSTLPSWGPLLRLDRVWGRARAVADHHRLRPLQVAVHRVLPEIALLPEPRGLAGLVAVLRDPYLRRVRATVEILDGYATLRPWMSAAVLTAARDAGRRAGLTGDRLAATVEATVLAAALDARAAGAPPTGDHDELPDLPAGPADGSGEEAAGQVAWLIAVARAHRQVTRQRARASSPEGIAGRDVTEERNVEEQHGVR
ncbi:MAB_1171c family putative transporter [Micromonospora sp. CPCC 205556]|uniref:MAB_1171c family putative transporter n=1 Tax=Micromonospora sp. CPCC 205556 TaxID=3122398 RepID=UPI002FEF8DBA